MDLPLRGGLSTWRGGKGGLCHQVRDRASTAVLKDRELGEGSCSVALLPSYRKTLNPTLQRAVSYLHSA